MRRADKYPDEVRVDTLVKLDMNGGNQKLTSRQMGVPQSTVNSWHRQFRGVSREIQEKRLKRRHEIIEGLYDVTLRGIPMVLEKMGDLPAEKVMDVVATAVRILELLAKTEREEAMVNIERIKSDFAYAIGNHITDPDILMAIANDLNQIMLPGTIPDLEENGSESGGFDFTDFSDSDSDGETGMPVRPDDTDETPNADTLYTQSGAVQLPGIDGPLGEPERAT